MKMRPGTQTGFLLCGKEWTEGEALEVRSPWDQGLVGRVTIATRADARQAVHHAVASLRRTRALPRWKRREILEDVAAALIEQKERFAQLIVAEAGKPVGMARAEVDRAVLTFKTAAEEASRLGGESIPLDLAEGNEGRWGLVQRFAVGPVLAITPFNFPLNLVAHKLAPAMAAGCPVILKPAPQTPFTALALGEVILKAGWPAEALAVLPLSNCILLLWYRRPFSFKNKAIQQVLGYALSDAFFDTLRTKQQTGYIAKAWNTEEERQLLQFFAVQSSTHTPIDLLARFELFLESFDKNLSTQIPEGCFESIRSESYYSVKMPPETCARHGQHF